MKRLTSMMTTLAVAVLLAVMAAGTTLAQTSPDDTEVDVPGPNAEETPPSLNKEGAVKVPMKYTPPPGEAAGGVQTRNIIEGDCGYSYLFVNNLGAGLAEIEMGFDLFADNLARDLSWGFGWTNLRFQDKGDRITGDEFFSPPVRVWDLPADIAVIDTSRGRVEAYGSMSIVLSDGGYCTSYYTGEQLYDITRITSG